MNTSNDATYTIKQDQLHPHRPNDGQRRSAFDQDAKTYQQADSRADTTRSTRYALSPMLSASGKAVARTHKALVLGTARLYHRVQRDLNDQDLSDRELSTRRARLRKTRTTDAHDAAAKNVPGKNVAADTLTADHATASMSNDSATFAQDLTYVPGWSTQAMLSDGTGIMVRPLLPEDRERLEEGFERLSAQSRYQRFMTPLDTLPEHYADYLTDIDYQTHFAVVAGVEDPVRFSIEGLGIARFIALTDVENEAELAITIADDAQGRGLGVLLMDLLLRAAKERGFVALRAEILPTNIGMQKLVKRFGGTRISVQDGLTTWRVPVPDTFTDASHLKDA